MHRTPLTVALLSLVAAACGELGPGVDAYEAGRFTEAHEAFTTLAAEHGDGASATLLYDLGLAALRAERYGDAESAARRAAATDPDFAGRGDFLLGNVAFARCELAALQATGPEAEPFAFDVAIRYAESAAERWQAAAASRDDWPAARRNVERALLRVQELVQDKAAAGQPTAKKEAGSDPRFTPKPGDPSETPPEDAPETPEDESADGGDATENEPAGPALTEIPAERVLGLLDVLAEKEQEKLSLRRERRAAQPPEVTEDW